jgi:hypothetical protein
LLDHLQHMMQRHFHGGGLASSHQLFTATLHQNLGDVAVLVFSENDVRACTTAGDPGYPFHPGFGLRFELGSYRRATARELDRHEISPWLELKSTLEHLPCGSFREVDLNARFRQ